MVVVVVVIVVVEACLIIERRTSTTATSKHKPHEDCGFYCWDEMCHTSIYPVQYSFKDWGKTEPTARRRGCHWSEGF